ncbi:MAG TPA: hypothetical protein VJT77_04425, partial [Burkholderiales bacterium]|nr:hypothetical protein [Burkholderiales bacterium]
MLGSRRHRFEILGGFAVIALGLWIIIALLLYQAHKQSIESADAAGRNIALSLAEYEDSSIRAIDLSLRQLREDWIRQPGSFGDAVSRHEDHLRKENVIQIAVVDAGGAMQYSRLPQSERQNFSDREYFQLQK